jgi:hypothetical protein
MGLFSDDVNGGTIVSAKFTRVRPHWSRRCGFHLRGRIFLWKNFSERVISASRLSRNHFAGGILSVQAHGCEAHLGSLLNRQKLVPISLVQQVPEPTVHAVLRVGTHLANLKRVRSIVFEEPRNPDELERKRFVLAHKGGAVAAVRGRSACLPCPESSCCRHSIRGQDRRPDFERSCSASAPRAHCFA